MPGKFVYRARSQAKRAGNDIPHIHTSPPTFKIRSEFFLKSSRLPRPTQPRRRLHLMDTVYLDMVGGVGGVGLYHNSIVGER